MRHAFIVPPRRRLLLRVRGHRRIKRTQDMRTHLGREPPVQHHRPVVLVPEGKAPALVLRIGPLDLLRALDLTKKAHELLDMLSGAVQSDVEEVGSFSEVAMRVSARSAATELEDPRCGRQAPQPAFVTGPNSSSVNPLSNK